MKRIERLYRTVDVLVEKFGYNLTELFLQEMSERLDDAIKGTHQISSASNQPISNTVDETNQIYRKEIMKELEPWGFQYRTRYRLANEGITCAMLDNCETEAALTDLVKGVYAFPSHRKRVIEIWLARRNAKDTGKDQSNDV